MARPRVIVLRAPGTNCNEETAHAFALAGGVAEQWHVNRLLESPHALDGYQVLCIPGGFSYGDDIGAGVIFSQKLVGPLGEALDAFLARDTLVLGICNGFQVLLKTELLLPPDDDGPPATLAANDSGKFEDRWVRLAAAGNKCVFLSGITEMELPVAHLLLPKSHLYLWVPNALIREGLEVMQHWGFTYKTNLVWYKVRQDGGPGIGQSGSHRTGRHEPDPVVHWLIADS